MLHFILQRPEQWRLLALLFLLLLNGNYIYFFLFGGDFIADHAEEI